MQSYCFLMKMKCGERNTVTVGTVSLSSLEIHPQCFASCSSVTLQQAAIKFKLSERLTVTECRVRCVSLHLKYIPDVVHSTLSQHFIVMPHLTTREADKQRLCSIRSCAQLKFGIPEQKKGNGAGNQESLPRTFISFLLQSATDTTLKAQLLLPWSCSFIALGSNILTYYIKHKILLCSLLELHYAFYF